MSLEELMDLLHDAGVEVVDDQEPDTIEEEVLASEEEEGMKKQRILFKHISIRWGIFQY